MIGASIAVGFFATGLLLEKMERETGAAERRLDEIALRLDDLDKVKDQLATVEEQLEALNVTYIDSIKEMDLLRKENSRRLKVLEPVLRGLILRAEWDESDETDMKEKARALSILGERSSDRSLNLEHFYPQPHGPQPSSSPEQNTQLRA